MFKLDSRLEQDTHHLTELGNNTLLLNKNACFYWFILVPHTAETELYKLPNDHQLEVLDFINKLSELIDTEFNIDKLNIATLGNVVAQLHIHIIGRRHNDVCWPNPIWGTSEFSNYTDADVELIKTLTTNLSTM